MVVGSTPTWATVEIEMFLVTVEHQFGLSYLGFLENSKPILGCKHIASKFDSSEEAEDATCYLQEIWRDNYYRCDVAKV